MVIFRSGPHFPHPHYPLLIARLFIFQFTVVPQELDKNSRERDQRRGKKPHKEKHKEKHKKKKKKKYQSDSDSSDNGSDVEFLS